MVAVVTEAEAVAAVLVDIVVTRLTVQIYSRIEGAG
jgi:hypothetical protein